MHAHVCIFAISFCCVIDRVVPSPAEQAEKMGWVVVVGSLSHSIKKRMRRHAEKRGAHMGRFVVWLWGERGREGEREREREREEREGERERTSYC